MLTREPAREGQASEEEEQTHAGNGNGASKSEADSRVAVARIVRSRVGQERVAALRRIDNHTNVLYLGIDWLVVVGAVVLATLVDSAWAVVVAVILVGSRQRALMNLVHQASHYQLFAARTWNDWTGQLLTAFPLFISLDGYRRSHMQHHAHLWDPTLDPKRRRYEEIGLEPGVRDRGSFIARHVVKPVFLTHVPFNVKSAIVRDDEPRTETAACIGFWIVVVAACWATGSLTWLLLLWVLPYVTTFQIMRYWGETAEHAGLRTTDPWMATRNWTATPLVRWLVAPHSDSYHLAHHIDSGVPHYRLHKLHRELLQIPEYAAGHHCDGFVIPRRPDAPSVVLDIVRPDNIRRYRPDARDATVTASP